MFIFKDGMIRAEMDGLRSAAEVGRLRGNRPRKWACAWAGAPQKEMTSSLYLLRLTDKTFQVENSKFGSI